MGIISRMYENLNYTENMEKWIVKRKEQGVTQKDIARDMSCTESMISRVENFKRKSYAAYYYYMRRFGG